MKHIGNMNQRHVSMFVYRNVLVCFAWQNDFKCYLFDIVVVFFCICAGGNVCYCDGIFYSFHDVRKLGINTF